jgi:four helix bundle protein
LHNIAEGFGRYESKDKTRFYKIARGSAYELISQSMISHALEYLSAENKNDLIDELKVIIGELDALIRSIEK